MQSALPGFPSYYSYINAIISFINYISLGIGIILLALIIFNKIKKKKIEKRLIIISIICFILALITSFIRMPYWS